MAQDGTTAGGSSYTIDNVTFPVGRTKLQSIFDAIRSTNIGNTAPDLVAGQFWIDNNTPSTTVWTLYFYDGTDNISFATIDTINNTVNFLDSTFDLINDTTPQLGGNLDLNSNDITGTGNINITGNLTASGNLTSLGIDDNATSTAITINSSERVGIGTASPSKKLTIYSDTSYDGILFQGYNHKLNLIESLHNNKQVLQDFKSGTGHYSIGLNNDNTFRFHDSLINTERMRIDTSGRVGIGTSNPQEKLNVIGSIRGDGFAGDPNYGFLFKARYDGATPLELQGNLSGGGWGIQNFLDWGVNGLRLFAPFKTGTNTPMIFSTSGSERMRIDSSGNILFGATSTDLNGSTGGAGILPQTNNRMMYISATTSTSDLFHFLFRNPNGDVGSIKTNGSSTAYNTSLTSGINGVNANEIAIKTNSTERMRIDSTGKVGIGTSSPDGKLQLVPSAVDTAIFSIRRQDHASTNLFEFFQDSNMVGGAGGAHLATNNRPFAISTDPSRTLGNGLVIDVYGKVGIGTSSPNRNLHISSGVSTSLQLERTASGTEGKLLLLSATSFNAIYSRDGSDSDKDFAIYTGSNERMRITSDGSIGIGTSSPEGKLHVEDNSGGIKILSKSADSGVTPNTNADELFLENSGTTGLTIGSGTSGSGTIYFGDSGNNSAGRFEYYHGDDSMRIFTSGSERMRISGNTVYVGKTTGDIGTNGVELKSNDVARFTQTSRNVIEINRKTDDGDIVRFKKDGTTVGSIGTAGGDIVVGTGNIGLRFNDSANTVEPWDINSNNGENNIIDLGYSGGRFKDLYLGGGLYVGGTGTANKLDDYEEGTWTPTLSGTTTGSALEGWYRKVGSLVTVTAILTNHTLSSSSGIAKITNLPFTITSALRGGAGVLGYNNSTTSSSNGGIFSQNTTEFVLYNSGTISTATFVDGSTKYFIMTGSYITD